MKTNIDLNCTAMLSLQIITRLKVIDTGNNRKIANFTYSYLYARPIKVETAKQLLSTF